MIQRRNLLMSLLQRFLGFLPVGDIVAKGDDPINAVFFVDEAAGVPQDRLGIAVLAVDAGLEILESLVPFQQRRGTRLYRPAVFCFRIHPVPDPVVTDHLFPGKTADRFGDVVPQDNIKTGVKHVEPDVDILDNAIREPV
jgi:hypothetical protein